MILHPVKNPKGDANRYCGPAVLSAIVGITTGEASRLIRSVAPHLRQVQGTSTSDITKAFWKCNIDFLSAPGPRNVTLAAWLDATEAQRGLGRVFLLVAGNHWQLVSGDEYVCGISRTVVPVTAPVVKRRARVTEAYELIAPRGIVVPSGIAKPRRPADTSAPHRRRAKLLAEQIGVQIERELGYWFVYHPDLEDEHDPCEGDHYATDWQDVLRRVETYAEALQIAALAA